jgi:alanyl-tRNA synthetase
MLSTAEIRANFLKFFEARGHTIVASSPLLPANDPTLLFTNAGMVQFKDVFLGAEKRPYSRATTVQRCVRAGGKHNDLENVGYTARHHTFFEMLGNFSFGDYFKREAIQYAWEFLTEMLQIPKERLFVTVFEDDDAAADIWLKEIGVDPKLFARIGAKDNFWAMGDTGPCGPCTEIFYDHGPDVAGGPPGSPEAEGDRFVEIWNLVFMQYNRDSDGNLSPLPHPSVDTGMGLERLAAVLQGVHNNYDIDLFKELIAAAGMLAGISGHSNTSLRVIADHIRSMAFLITDGVTPSNEGRGYVLRRIIRRAARHGHKLGLEEPFIYKLVAPLDTLMGDAYPELHEARSQVERVIKQEEERFAETLGQGMGILEHAIADLQGRVIDGETVFRLYDTYGFPVDLTADIARERGLMLDMKGYETCMAAQRERGRAESSFRKAYTSGLHVVGSTNFTGYERTEDRAAVTGLYIDGNAVKELNAGDAGVVVLDHSPFYAESGGQAGDSGQLTSDAGAVFSVSDTQKAGDDAIAHVGKLDSGSLRIGDPLIARVDDVKRQKTRLNHSATHLMHAALRQVLGMHVTQKGSLVCADYLRFDFSHSQPVTREELERIENLVNAQIRANNEVETRIMELEAAKAAGAMALFGEKYDEQVRVLRMGEFSTELCGGTHVARTGDIGLFKITSEGGIAAGVRRIEALTGDAALEYVRTEEATLAEMAALMKSDTANVRERLQKLMDGHRQLEKELEQLKGKLASAAGSDLAAGAVDVDGIKVLAARLPGADAKTLRETVDQLKNKLGSAAVVLAAVDGDKISLVAGVTKDSTARLKAGELVNAVAQQVGGKGGGRPDMAQAGGNDPAALDDALASVPSWVAAQLGS